jgi:3-hydroxyisobutyrate dehydrogenase-like beta-hydroxyacid dehydrogenase
MQLKRLGLVGFGEVGRIFASGLQAHFDAVTAWDLQFPLNQDGAADAAAQAGISVAESIPALCAGSDLLISAVTASNTFAVAEAAAPHLRPDMVFLDLNSASPGTKQQAASLVQAAGAHYVEAGVMTSVPPYGIRVPMLLGGAKSVEMAAWLNTLGMNVKSVSSEIGIASAIKMCRSVMIKGMEALVIESFTTARAYGVEDLVLPTLAETFPSIDWEQTGAYFFSRVVKHGQRRAEEMRESANTVAETGFPSIMAAAIANKQQWVSDHAKEGVFAGVAQGAPWQSYADALLKPRNV